MEIIYGGEDGCFSSLRAKDTNAPILNLEQGHAVTRWGRMIFYVADVDAFWAYLRGKGFHPESPRDAARGERYFHMSDPEGHELSFARPLRWTWRKLRVRRKAYHSVVIPAGGQAAPLMSASTEMSHS